MKAAALSGAARPAWWRCAQLGEWLPMVVWAAFEGKTKLLRPRYMHELLLIGGWRYLGSLLSLRPRLLLMFRQDVDG